MGSAWDYLFHRRSGRLRTLTKLGIPRPKISLWDFVVEGGVFVLLLWQAVTVLSASADWEVESPGGGGNPYGDFVGYVGAIYAVVETADVAADMALAYMLKRGIDGPRLAAAVLAQQLSYALGFLVLGMSVSALSGRAFARAGETATLPMFEVGSLISLAAGAAVHGMARHCIIPTKAYRVAQQFSSMSHCCPSGCFLLSLRSLFF